jgi:hypothetical protein
MIQRFDIRVTRLCGGIEVEVFEIDEYGEEENVWSGTSVRTAAEYVAMELSELDQ